MREQDFAREFFGCKRLLGEISNHSDDCAHMADFSEDRSIVLYGCERLARKMVQEQQEAAFRICAAAREE